MVKRKCQATWLSSEIQPPRLTLQPSWPRTKVPVQSLYLLSASVLLSPQLWVLCLYHADMHASPLLAWTPREGGVQNTGLDSTISPGPTCSINQPDSWLFPKPGPRIGDSCLFESPGRPLPGQGTGLSHTPPLFRSRGRNTSTHHHGWDTSVLAVSHIGPTFFPGALPGTSHPGS